MTDGHLDTEVLAEYEEGLLTSSRAVHVEEHLAECPTCSATLEQLGLVRTRLSKAPRMVPIPAAVAARIDQALAAERAAPEEHAAPARTATVHPFRRQLPRLLAAAATVAAVAFGGYVVSTSGGGAESASTTTNAEGSGAEATDADESGEDVTSDDQRAESAPEETPLASGRAVRTALAAEIQAIARSRLQEQDAAGEVLAGDCGSALARELHTELIGVASTDVAAPDAVLVVVETDQPGVARGVVLPTCDASLDDALTELTVPIE
jgi:negative regulator of sigma E activity